jgi:hypothetical protein
MKKILSIVLGLVLVLSLSLATATSVGANVHDVSCNVTPDTVDIAANYTIVFNITSTLAIGATISIEFPTGTTVPTTYATGVVTVQGTDISSGDISVSGRVVTITLPEAIGAPKGVTVFFHEAADIKNPATKGIYNLSVKTSKETTWVDSDDYTIRLADFSTYEFVFAVPDIWVNEPAEVDVKLQTDVLGLDGYAHGQIVFNVTDQPSPSAVTFNVSYLGVWNSTTDSGTWPPGGGNFTVQKDELRTIQFKLRFNTVGVYMIKFVLKDVDTDEVLGEDEISFAATGVSREVELNNGWNLMSLPIVPDEDDIEVVLADIMDDVISVHYYRATTGTWLIYAPPDHTSLTELEDGKAYWINMSAAANLTVVGQAIAAPGVQGGLPPTYDVVEGWNMVGFKSTGNMTAGNYLDGTDPVRIYGFDITQGGWFPLTTGQNMTPGLGYWVAFSEPGTIYP